MSSLVYYDLYINGYHKISQTLCLLCNNISEFLHWLLVFKRISWLCDLKQPIQCSSAGPFNHSFAKGWLHFKVFHCRSLFMLPSFFYCNIMIRCSTVYSHYLDYSSQPTLLFNDIQHSMNKAWFNVSSFSAMIFDTFPPLSLWHTPYLPTIHFRLGLGFNCLDSEFRFH